MLPSFLTKWINPYVYEKLSIYGQLMRIDKPIGTFLLLWPTAWSVWIASDGKPSIKNLLIFTIGTFLMRSAGCVVNDWADRDYDGKVARTQNRPFARNAVQPKEAFFLVSILLLMALVALLLLHSPLANALALVAVVIALTYPFMKRFFPVPQSYLGLAFSMGIPIAFASIQGQVPAIAWWLFAANFFWTIAYDTIYALADKADDLKIGIKTSAITFGDYVSEITMLCYGLFNLLMMNVGLMLSANWAFWVCSILTIVYEWSFYLRIEKQDPQQCFRIFKLNNRIGMAWWIALLIHYAYA